jgi:hypothetical protein
MTARGSTARRGYGWQHEQHPHPAWRCARCGRPIHALEAWDLDHDSNDRSRYLGPSHRRCMTLAESGELRPTVIDNLTGTDLTEGLRAYVRWINLNPDDEALQVGTGKKLDEAAARHILEERTGSYPVGGHEGSFPVTLAHAFHAVGFAVPGKVPLDDDPHRAVQQCLFLLGTSVNRLRACRHRPRQARTTTKDSPAHPERSAPRRSRERTGRWRIARHV